MFFTNQCFHNCITLCVAEYRCYCTQYLYHIITIAHVKQQHDQEQKHQLLEDEVFCNVNVPQKSSAIKIHQQGAPKHYLSHQTSVLYREGYSGMGGSEMGGGGECV